MALSIADTIHVPVFWNLCTRICLEFGFWRLGFAWDLGFIR